LLFVSFSFIETSATGGSITAISAIGGSITAISVV